MSRKFLIPLVLPFTLAAAPALAAPGGEAAQCLADLKQIAAFLPVNDAGAGDLLADHGPAIEKAYLKAEADAAGADKAGCDKLLQTYLRAWRPGHLAVLPAPSTEPKQTAAAGEKPAVDPRLPRFKVLSKDTVLLVLPSFMDQYGAPIKAMLAEHRAALVSHPNWIIDVRANGGGSDSTYKPLLGWLLEGDYPQHRVEYLVTPANLRAQEQVCAATADPARCASFIDPIVSKMRAAPAGSFVLGGDARVEYDGPDERETKVPARVAVLVDRKCGSSCEQFLLSARTSFRVKLVGRPSFGSIDASNMRPHPLPSGRVLYYATTRSTRVPDMAIDGIGIAPDILLPKPADEAGREAEVKQVRQWLETGSWL